MRAASFEPLGLVTFSHETFWKKIQLSSHFDFSEEYYNLTRSITTKIYDNLFMHLIIVSSRVVHQHSSHPRVVSIPMSSVHETVGSSLHLLQFSCNLFCKKSQSCWFFYEKLAFFTFWNSVVLWKYFPRFSYLLFFAVYVIYKKNYSFSRVVFLFFFIFRSICNMREKLFIHYFLQYM